MSRPARRSRRRPGSAREAAAGHVGAAAALQALMAEVMFGVPDRMPTSAVAILGDLTTFANHLFKGLFKAEVVLVEEVAKVPR